jgi:hypothetical protein
LTNKISPAVRLSGGFFHGKEKFMKISEYQTGEASGSDKRYSFSMPAENAQELHVFESAIDLLSFATLCPEAQQDHLLSLAGVFAATKDCGGRLPIALSRYLEDYPEIQRVDAHLDNDAAGRAATQNISYLLGAKFEFRDCQPTRGKDVNDELCHVLGLNPAKKERDAR